MDRSLLHMFAWLNRLARIAAPGVVALVAASASANAGIYLYVDEQGGLNLSNDPDDVRYGILVEQVSEVVADVVQTQDAPRAVTDWSAYEALIKESAAKFKLDPALLHAVIRVESAYNPRAVSRRGAGGLMQLMPATARRMGVSDVFDPVQNVQGGARYLGELLKIFNNDLQLALAAYNAGENAVMKYGRRIPPYRETIDYVVKVVNFYNQYRGAM